LRVDGRDPTLKMGGFDKNTNNKLVELFDHMDMDVDMNKN
jgi:hypothetical protein